MSFCSVRKVKKNIKCNFDLLVLQTDRLQTIFASDAIHAAFQPLLCHSQSKNKNHTRSFNSPTTHIYSVPLEDAELKEELQFDLPFLEQLLHLALGFIQLLQHTLDVSHGAVVGGLVA